MEIKRGDIVYTNLDGAKGSEQGKNRVCVVLQNNIGNKYSPTTIIVPLTSQIKKLDQPTHVYVRKDLAIGLENDSMTECEQPRTIDKCRIIRKMGKIIDRNLLKEIFLAYVAGCDDLGGEY